MQTLVSDGVLHATGNPEHFTTARRQGGGARPTRDGAGVGHLEGWVRCERSLGRKHTTLSRLGPMNTSLCW